MMVNRGTVEGFIHRTRVNLELVEKSSEGHTIIQLMNSLLGIVVYPLAKDAFDQFKSQKISTLGINEWSTKIQLMGDSNTVYDFVNHMRNAVSHGHITFSSDSRKLNDVIITFADRPGKNQPFNWRVEFGGAELRQLCTRLMELIENTVG